MTARDQIRAMLDQLMGTDNGSAKSSMSFEDRRVCRPFLLNCCPHEILSGTRVDLGECTKTHEYALRADYERAAGARDLYYEIDALEMLNKFVAECDRKTENAKRKLQETQEELGEEAARKMNSIHELGEQIGTKLAKAEELGAQGLVDESMKLLEEVELLRKAKSDAEQDFRATMPASTYQQQKLRVCEVCSAYLGIHDNDRRLADHFGGKLHLGFIQIRDKLADLKKRVAEINEKRELERKNRRNSPPSSSRNDRRIDNRDRGDYRSSRRSRDRDRDRDRRQSGSKSDRHSTRHSRGHRSRSHGRRHSKRSRSRSSSSRRHRRSRSRSGTSSTRHHHRHRHDSRSPAHSKQNGRSDSRSKDKSNEIALPVDVAPPPTPPPPPPPPPPAPPAHVPASVPAHVPAPVPAPAPVHVPAPAPAPAPAPVHVPASAPAEAAVDDDDEETTRILESIQRSMNEENNMKTTPME